MDQRNWNLIRNPDVKRFLDAKFRLTNVLANGAIGTNLLVELNSSGLYTVGSAASTSIIGANNGSGVANGVPLDVDYGKVKVKLGSPVLYKGQKIKCVGSGLAAAVVATQANIMAPTAGNFGNQPANDGVEVVSSEGADVGTVTIYGTTHGGSTILSETVTLTGATAVATTKVNWGLIVGIEAEAHAGTITVREASADQTITTLATGTNSKGVESVLAADINAYGNIPLVVAGGASTKVFGIEFYTVAGVLATEVVTLNGATDVPFTARASRITRVFAGDVATGTTTTVKTSAADSATVVCGIAVETSTIEGVLIDAYVKPV